MCHHDALVAQNSDQPPKSGSVSCLSYGPDRSLANSDIMIFHRLQELADSFWRPNDTDVRRGGGSPTCTPGAERSQVRRQKAERPIERRQGLPGIASQVKGELQ
jgi:hypothetical protein